MKFRAAVWVLAAVPVALAQTVNYTDVPFVPTSPKVMDAMLELADVKPGDVLVDLGSGDGRIVNTAAKRYGIRAVGIEIIPELVEQSEKSAREMGVADRVRFIHGDLFAQDLREATIVTAFLTPGVNLRLRPKLLRELKPGTRVVTRTFPIGGWEPVKTVRVDNDRVDLWVIPDAATPRPK